MLNHLRLFVLVVLGISAAQAQNITGTVLDAQTNEPLPYVRIKAVQPQCSTVAQTLTDGNGRFVLMLADCSTQPTDSVIASMVGYMASATLLQPFMQGDRVLRLKPESVNLATVEITALKKAGSQIVHKAYNHIAANYPTTLFAVTDAECNALQQSTWQNNTKRALRTTRLCLSDSGYTTDLRTIKPHTLEYNQDSGYKSGFGKSGTQIDTAIGKRYSRQWGIIAYAAEKTTWPYYEYDPIRQAHQEGPGSLFLRFNQDFVKDAKFSEPSLGRFKLFDTDRILVSFTYEPTGAPLTTKSNVPRVNYRGNIYIDPDSYAIVKFTYEIVLIDINGQSLVASAQQTDYTPLNGKSRKMVLARYQKTFELRYYNPGNTSDYYSIINQFKVCNINYGKPVKITTQQAVLNPSLPLDLYRCQE